MILRGLSIRNWRNIESLELVGLAPEFVIIHGPNKSGKSSAIEALRGCLLDFEYDSGHRSLRSATPRGTQLSPEVRVEFEAAGSTYEMCKVFSRRKDGKAILRQKYEDTWADIERGKEASKAAREILGVDSSNEGLFQLLWVEQGVVNLPPQKDISQPLERRLENVMGSLVSARQLDIMGLLNEKSSPYLTERMADRRNSPLRLRQKDLEVRRSEFDDLERKYGSIQALVSQHDLLTSEIETATADLKSAQEEVRSLSEQATNVAERKQSYATAVRALKLSSRSVDALEKKLDRHRALTEKLEGRSEQLQAGKTELAILEGDFKTHQDRHEEVSSAAQCIRKQLGELHGSRSELDDRERLIRYTSDSERVAKLIKQAADLSSELRSVEMEIAESRAPTKEHLDELRAGRRKSERLRADLDAGRLRVKATSIADMTLDATVDDAESEVTRLQPGYSHEWQMRQKARFEIPSLGVIEVSRGVEDFDLEKINRRIKEIDAEYVRDVRSYGTDPDAANALDRLLERRVRHDAAVQRRDELADGYRQVAPEGLDSLKKERDEIESRMQDVYDRSPDLRDWIVDEADLQKRQSDVQTELRRLRQAAAAAEGNVERCERELENARTAQQEAQLSCTRWRAELPLLKADLESLGSKGEIREELARAKTAMRDAQQSLEDAKLTEGEQAVEGRLAEACAAEERREVRLRRLEDDRTLLKGQLIQTDGLHMQVASAQAEITGLADDIDDLQITVDAYRLLAKSLNDAREAQVRRATGPIASRVMKWASQLGLTEYSDIEFGNSYVPEGLVSRIGHASVALRDESYGTEEQLSILVRLAIGGLLSHDENQCAILDDPLAHADDGKHRRMLDIVKDAARGGRQGPGQHQVGPLQVVIFTCHPERFDHVADAQFIRLADSVRYHPAM